VPDRIENIMSTLMTRTTESCLPDDELSFKPCEVAISNEFERATLELLSRIHSAEYLAFINDLSKELERKRKQQLIEETQYNTEGVVQEKPSNVVPFTPMVCETVSIWSMEPWGLISNISTLL
jgi:acetoin utilization deacetylase AcuC-like enzyme